jgi:hypothetical protein
VRKNLLAPLSPQDSDQPALLNASSSLSDKSISKLPRSLLSIFS